MRSWVAVGELVVRTTVWDEPPAPVMAVEVVTAGRAAVRTTFRLPLQLEWGSQWLSDRLDISDDALFDLLVHLQDAQWRTPTSQVVPVTEPTGPRLSRPVARLIAGAVEHLPPDLRERYEYDFRTDALWIDGRWARLRYALGLRLWTVRRLRRAAADLPRRA